MIGDGDEDDRAAFAAGQTPPRTLAVTSAVFVLPLFVVVGSVIQTLHAGYGIWFTELFLFLGVPFVLVRMSARHPVRWPGILPFRASQAGYGFALGAANFLAMVVPLQFAAQLVFPPEWVEAVDSARIFRDRSSVELVMIVAGVSLAAPFAEEYFFRGTLQHAAHEAKARKWPAIIGVAILFSAFHFDPVGFTARAELGILFGWLFWRTRNLWAAVFAHAANNIISTLIFFSSQGQARPESTELEGVMQIVAAAAIGWVFVLGLLWLPKKFPSLLRRAELDAPAHALPPARLYPTAAPWIVGALLSFALLLAFEHRTMAINWFDVGHPLPAQTPQAEVEALRELRVRARRGEVPMEAYQVEREAVIARSGGREGQSPTVPVPPPPLPPPDPAPPTPPVPAPENAPLPLETR